MRKEQEKDTKHNRHNHVTVILLFSCYLLPIHYVYIKYLYMAYLNPQKESLVIRKWY